MRWAVVVIAIAAFGGCLSVDATRIRKGVYVVNVRGNAIGGQGQAVTAAHERASQLCPDGYELEDSASDSTSAYFRTSYGLQQVRKPEVTIVVRCNQPEQPEQPAPGPPTPAGTAAKCQPATELGHLQTFYGTLPPGTSEDAVYNAALQFAIASGNTILSQDPTAHTIATTPFTGQTLTSTCGINEYRVYEVRAVVAGPRMIVTLGCHASFGNEANRGALRDCALPTYAGKTDAAIPRIFFEGAVGMMDLRRTDPLQGWSCLDSRLCTRREEDCQRWIAEGRGAKCEARSRAYCDTAIGSCFGDPDVCAIGSRVCVYMD